MEAGSPLVMQNRDMLTLTKGEVLVQIKAAPINPSDLMMVAGLYPHKKQYPFVPGLEASGLVVASGGGFMANFMLGKRVACSAPETGDGTYAEYMRLPATNCIPLLKKLDYLSAAGAIVNPLTALALIERIKVGGHRSFINTAAAGALGKMLNKLAREENLTCINIVRDAAQVEMLKSLGATEIINQNSTDFDSKLAAFFTRHNTTIVLDAIGGNFTYGLLQLAPSGAVVIAYASLSKEMIHFNPSSFIRYGKRIEGFHLAHWIGQQSRLKMLIMARKAQKLIADGMLASHVANRFNLSQINEALASYSAQMSAGKHVLVF